MELTANPLLTATAPASPVVNPAVIAVATIKRAINYGNIAELRQENAEKAIAELKQDGMEIFGLTRGQFSLSDLLKATLIKTGPAELAISTWTAAHADVERMMNLLKNGLITDCKWLVDHTFVRRVPALTAQIRQQFGDDAIRVTKTHAKFATITNESWQVAIRSSMNLNQNPRLESFQIGHDPVLCKFLNNALADIWRRQERSLQDASSNQQTQWWKEYE